MAEEFSLLKTDIQSRLYHKKKIHNELILNRWAAVNLVLHFSDCWRLAMIKRVENLSDPWSGHYAFPGGRVEEGERHEDAALRETSEEIGLTLKNSDSLGLFYSFQIVVKDKPINLGISSLLTVTRGELPCLTPEPKEVQEAYWFKVSDLLNVEFITRQHFRGHTGNSFRPCIKIGNHTIWGISYLIFLELVTQLDGLVLSDHLTLDSSLLPPF